MTGPDVMFDEEQQQIVDGLRSGSHRDANAKAVLSSTGTASRSPRPARSTSST